MRNMTSEELRLVYRKGVWPCGHGSEYERGPVGGICQNIRCPTCGLELNITTVGFEFGQVIFEPEGYVIPEPVKLTRWQRWKARLSAVIGGGERFNSQRLP